MLSGPVGAVVPGSSGAAPDGLSHPSLTAPADDTRPVMTVAWPDTLVNPYDAFTIHETIAALKERLRGYCIRTATFAAAEECGAFREAQARLHLRAIGVSARCGRFFGAHRHEAPQGAR